MGIKERLATEMPGRENSRRRLVVEKIVTELMEISDLGEPLEQTFLGQNHKSLMQRIRNQPGGFSQIIEIVELVLKEKSEEANG